MFDLKTVCGFSLAMILCFTASVSAQDGNKESKKTGGFLPIVKPNPSSAELEQQEDLWILDVAFKPMRLRALEMTNPKTGEKERKTVWYLVYKVRYSALERPVDPADQVPVNIEDDRRIGHIFVPEFELVTHDNEETKSYRDEIHPDLVAALAQRERLPLQSSIDIAGDLDQAAEGEYRYGVAVWTGVDPRTDFFTLYASGFSSAYRINPDNNVLQKRTIMLEYARPGDEYDEAEYEFHPTDDPTWIYRPTEVKVDRTAAK